MKAPDKYYKGRMRTLGMQQCKYLTQNEMLINRQKTNDWQKCLNTVSVKRHGEVHINTHC